MLCIHLACCWRARRGAERSVRFSVSKLMAGAVQALGKDVPMMSLALLVLAQGAHAGCPWCDADRGSAAAQVVQAIGAPESEAFNFSNPKRIGTAPQAVMCVS